jgi:type VI secretion system secreted protein Hcp
MAAVDYFLKLDGIKGESRHAKHKDEIDVESWSWGASNAGGATAGPRGGAGAGKVSMQDFHFVMKLNAASPSLMRACATGQHIKTATLSGRKAGKGQQDYLTFKLHDVLVSSYQTSGSEQADVVPTDQVALSFSKIEAEYRLQKADGSFVSAGQFRYDLQANKPF